MEFQEILLKINEDEQAETLQGRHIMTPAEIARRKQQIRQLEKFEGNAEAEKLIQRLQEQLDSK